MFQCGTRLTICQCWKLKAAEKFDLLSYKRGHVEGNGRRVPDRHRHNIIANVLITEQALSDDQDVSMATLERHSNSRPSASRPH